MLIATIGILAVTGAPLMGGAAAVDITPDLQWITVSLGGYGDRQGKPATGVHDRLFARALALQQGSQRFALLSLDLLCVAPTMRDDLLHELADLHLDQGLLMCASHSHGAPENIHKNGDVLPQAFGRYNDFWYQWLLQRMEQAVRQAFHHLQPVQVGSQVIRLEGFSRNRRGERGSGLVDPDATVVRIADQQGRTLALVVDFAAHGTFMDSTDFEVCGDWPGAMARALEEAVPGAVALYCQGATGDVSPVKEGDGDDYQRAESYGRAVAQRLLQAAQTSVKPNVELRCVTLNEPLPPLCFSPAFLESTAEEYPMDVSKGAAFLSLLFPTQAAFAAVHIGDLLFASMPGEVVTSIGLEFKEAARKMGYRVPVLVGYANNYAGYIVSPQDYDSGGYETGTSFYGRDVGPEMLKRALAAVRALEGKP
jgi:hypothetical protein